MEAGMSCLGDWACIAPLACNFGADGYFCDQLGEGQKGSACKDDRFCASGYACNDAIVPGECRMLGTLLEGQPRFSVDATQGRTVFAKTNKSSLALGGMIAWVSIADRPNTLSAPAAVLTHQPGLAMDILGAKFSLADRG